MAELMMDEIEYEYYQKSISEACRLIGQEALLFPVNSVLPDIYDDRTVSYDGVRSIGLLFESNPRPLLKKFNWITEDEELPFVANIVPFDDTGEPFNITEDMIIVIKNRLGFKSERSFIVRNVRGSSIDPLMYVCKLSPYRPKVDFNPNTVAHDKTYNKRNDVNSSYLNRGKYK